MTLRILSDTVRSMASIAAFFTLAAAFSACGPRITNQNIAVINAQRQTREVQGKGISPKEVESILGLPSKVETFKIPLVTQRPTLDGVRYFYEQDGQTIELHFVDGKLISNVPLLGSEAPAKETK
jgi:hypothetical protein